MVPQPNPGVRLVARCHLVHRTLACPDAGRAAPWCGPLGLTRTTSHVFTQPIREPNRWPARPRDAVLTPLPGFSPPSRPGAQATGRFVFVRQFCLICLVHPKESAMKKPMNTQAAKPTTARKPSPHGSAAPAWPPAARRCCSSCDVKPARPHTEALSSNRLLSQPRTGQGDEKWSRACPGRTVHTLKPRAPGRPAW